VENEQAAFILEGSTFIHIRSNNGFYHILCSYESFQTSCMAQKNGPIQFVTSLMKPNFFRSVGTNLSSSHSTLTRKFGGSSVNLSGSLHRQSSTSGTLETIDFVEPLNADRNYARSVGKELGEKIESFRARIDGMRLQVI
jgi:hypothetical protein